MTSDRHSRTWTWTSKSRASSVTAVVTIIDLTRRQRVARSRICIGQCGVLLRLSCAGASGTPAPAIDSFGVMATPTRGDTEAQRGSGRQLPKHRAAMGSVCHDNRLGHMGEASHRGAALSEQIPPNVTKAEPQTQSSTINTIPVLQRPALHLRPHQYHPTLLRRALLRGCALPQQASDSRPRSVDPRRRRHGP